MTRSGGKCGLCRPPPQTRPAVPEAAAPPLATTTRHLTDDRLLVGTLINASRYVSTSLPSKRMSSAIVLEIEVTLSKGLPYSKGDLLDVVAGSSDSEALEAVFFASPRVRSGDIIGDTITLSRRDSGELRIGLSEN